MEGRRICFRQTLAKDATFTRTALGNEVGCISNKQTEDRDIVFMQLPTCIYLIAACGGGAWMVGLAGDVCCRLLARYQKRGGGFLSVSGPIRKAGGMIMYWGAQGIVKFMHTGINRQCKRAAINIKCGPKSYEFIFRGGGGGGGARTPSSTPLDPPLKHHIF